MYKLEEWEKRSYLFMGKPGTKKTLTLKTFMPQEYRDAAINAINIPEFDS